MRSIVLFVSACVLAFLAWFFLGNGSGQLSAWAAAGQEEAQRAMAGALRALRANDPGALAALWGLCFTYGFFHAAGPGHGKILIGGYGLGSQIPLMRLSGLALASSLAQGMSAILLVGAGMLLLGWGRQDMVTAAEDWFAPFSYGAIALIGLWLCYRGLRGLSLNWSLRSNLSFAGAVPEPGHNHHHDHTHHDIHHQHTHDHHHHGDGEVCATCGHAHGPSLEQAQSITSWRDAAALIGAIAMRPCTGAIFVLVITFRWGLVWQGITAVLAMAIGVAAITIAVGIAAVTLREGPLRQSLVHLSDTGAARALSVVELCVGATVALVAGGLMVNAL